MTVKEFLDRFEQEDSPKFMGEVYVLCRDYCVGWLLKQSNCNDEDVAKDIFSDALLALFDNAEKKKLNTSNTQIKTYLTAICRNMLSNLNNQVGKPLEIEFEKLIETFAEENPNLTIEKETLLKHVALTMSRLKGHCATLFKLYVLEGYSHKEIADLEGYSSEDTVKALYYKCKKSFRDLFGDFFNA